MSLSVVILGLDPGIRLSTGNTNMVTDSREAVLLRQPLVLHHMIRA